jgi:hypothetical protein
MKHIKTLVVAIAGLVLATASSQASMLLSDLLAPGATLQQGDKIFGNFTWTGPIAANQINITGIGDGSAGNLYGIEIGGPIASPFGGGIIDLQLHYSVTIAPGYNNLISDIHQFANVGGSPDSLVAITESVLNAPGGLQVAISHVGEGINYANFDPTDPVAELNDTLVLGTPLHQVWINKDIYLAAAPGGSAQATIIDQRFSQTAVPEPTTMIAGALLLLPFGASTLRILRKNRTA